MSEKKISPLKLIYTDKNKRKWFGFKDPLQLPPKRALAAMVYSRFADLRITPQRLDAILNEMEKLFNAGEFMKAGALVEELRISEELYCEPATLKQLGTVYIIGEGEDPAEYANHVNQEKVKQWEEDGEAEAFFLQFAWTFTRAYLQFSGLNTQDYFNKQAAAIKRLGRYGADVLYGTT